MDNLECPLKRNYANLVNFKREYIDLFYDYVECLHELVFVKGINPYSKQNYMQDPHIFVWNFNPSIYIDELNASSSTNMYEFKVSYKLINSLPTKHIVYCFIRIFLRPTFTQDYFQKPYVFSYIMQEEDLNYTRNLNMDCFNHDIYMDISRVAKSHNIGIEAINEQNMDAILSKHYVNLLKVWITISKNNKTPTQIKEIFQSTILEYFQAVAEKSRFDTVTMPAFEKILIQRMAPTHEQSPYLKSIASEPSLVQMIRDQGTQSFFADFMRKLSVHK
jgi:hypothetical protein